MTKLTRCPLLYEASVGISKDRCQACGGYDETGCPKSRGKYHVTQKCWSVDTEKIKSLGA